MSNFNEYFNINNDLFENDLSNNAFEPSEGMDELFIESDLNDEPIEEGRALALGAGLLGGGPGALSSHYDLQKEKAAKQALAQLRGDPVGQYAADNTGTKFIANSVSMIPVIGALASNYSYQRRVDAENELKKELEKRNMTSALSRL